MGIDDNVDGCNSCAPPRDYWIIGKWEPTYEWTQLSVGVHRTRILPCNIRAGPFVKSAARDCVGIAKIFRELACEKDWYVDSHR